MVIRHRKILFCIIFTIIVITITSESHAFMTGNVSAIQYRIDKEWVVIWINTDGSIELHYNITIIYESSALGYLTIGLPKGNFDVHAVTDISGMALNYEDVSGKSGYPEFGVEIYFGHAMNSGDNGTVLLITTVPNMFSPDTMNPGYMGMQFVPTYFDATVVDLRVAIVPPQGVTQDDVKTMDPAFFTTVDGDFALYWNHTDLSPNEQKIFGVSIPEQYITLPGLDIGFYAVIVLGIGCIVAVILLVIRRLRRAVYEKPRVSIEALGPRRGLTAVEAAVVVDVPPVRVLTMILFSLLYKRLIRVTETEPIIQVEKIEEPQRERSAPSPRYYEIDFLNSVQSDGTLNERGLARAFLSLRANVDKRLRGYSRVDTANYYQSIVAKGWEQVTQADTPQLKGEAIEQNMQWLLMDENYSDKFRNSFPPGLMIMPRPGWWWYWQGPYSPQSSLPTPTGSTTPSEMPPIPGQDWANNVVRGFETVTNNIVRNVEDFTNKLIVPQTKQSTTPIRRGSSCVCACASCACACACVSCACACAGGGAR
jgi:hypothetical protein